MSTILDEIVATKRQEIALAKAARPEAELLRALESAPPFATSSRRWQLPARSG